MSNSNNYSTYFLQNFVSPNNNNGFSHKITNSYANNNNNNNNKNTSLKLLFWNQNFYNFIYSNWAYSVFYTDIREWMEKKLQSYQRYNWIPEGSIKFVSVEQWLMALKAIVFNNEFIFQQIMAENDPAKIKKLGEKVQMDLNIWKEIQEDILFEGVYCKFDQNKILGKLLLAAYLKGVYFAEASPYDKIYGIGLAPDDKRAQYRSNWNGKNILGKILFKVAEILSKNYSLPNGYNDTNVYGVQQKPQSLCHSHKCYKPCYNGSDFCSKKCRNITCKCPSCPYPKCNGFDYCSKSCGNGTCSC